MADAHAPNLRGTWQLGSALLFFALSFFSMFFWWCDGYFYKTFNVPLELIAEIHLLKGWPAFVGAHCSGRRSAA